MASFLSGWVERGENRRRPRPIEEEQRKIVAGPPIACGLLNQEAATRKGDAFRVYQGQGLLVADQFQKPD